ncbi:SRPBCC family protein [Dactylosporangium sp. NPDC005555]|uniref:SRPBCC family protein n=1 Tax=Dactylosporangium sp. NPDC005555 TaxID=3154889 RepID=UPI0033B006EC
MAGQSSTKAAGGIGEKIAELLVRELGNLLSAAGQRAVDAAGQKLSSVTDRLTEYASGQGGGQGGAGIVAAVTGAKKVAEGKSPLRAAFSGGLAGMKEKVKGLFGGGKGGKAKKLKLTNIEETLDVGVPVRVAYNQWTQYEDFPSFMKKVENVDRPSDEKTNWKAQVFWSHRTWEATTIQQVPDQNIVWRSKGPKGHVDGAVTFHEMLPNMTRIMLVMEYHPQGLFERTGNLWRAQGRRARLEFKHFRRHVMTQTILKPDEVEGWRGEIRDGEVVKDHETAMREEQEAREREQGGHEEDRRPQREDRPSQEEGSQEEGEHEDRFEGDEEEAEREATQKRPARQRREDARAR